MSSCHGKLCDGHTNVVVTMHACPIHPCAAALECISHQRGQCLLGSALAINFVHALNWLLFKLIASIFSAMHLQLCDPSIITNISHANHVIHISHACVCVCMYGRLHENVDLLQSSSSVIAVMPALSVMPVLSVMFVCICMACMSVCVCC